MHIYANDTKSISRSSSHCLLVSVSTLQYTLSSASDGVLNRFYTEGQSMEVSLFFSFPLNV